MALALLFASLPGPWLTLGLPGGLLFALLDRRVAARAAGVVVVALVAALMVGSTIGAVLLGVGAGVTVVAAAVVARGDRALGMDTLLAPTLATGGLALTAVVAVGGEAVTEWETALAEGVAQGGRRAVEQYRAFGMSPESLTALEALTRDVADALVAVWPALAALALWLGSWLGLRLLGRRGRVSASLVRRLVPRPFERFRPPEGAVWPLIAGLAGLWADVPGVHRAAANVVLALGLVYVLTGLAITWWWTGRRGMGSIARAVLVVLGALFLTPFAVAAWVAIGLADVWLGFREREPNS
ncbi:MAG TPA: DUF2232 domain-containing protein [Gemmatimonadota bacterium]|nr:DUF2232 domain-containing protein [Gemmatimonadota bacterium]